MQGLDDRVMHAPADEEAAELQPSLYPEPGGRVDGHWLPDPSSLDVKDESPHRPASREVDEDRASLCAWREQDAPVGEGQDIRGQVHDFSAELCPDPERVLR